MMRSTSSWTPEVLGRCPAVRAHDAESRGPRRPSAARRTSASARRWPAGCEVALHREDAVDDDELPGVRARRWRAAAPGAPCRCGGSASSRRRQAQPSTREAWSMPVGEDHVVAADEGRDGPEVGLEAGGEDQRRLLPEELRESVSSSSCRVEGAVEEAASRAGRCRTSARAASAAASITRGSLARPR